jgi:hypothetical protein
MRTVEGLGNCDYGNVVGALESCLGVVVDAVDRHRVCE